MKGKRLFFLLAILFFAGGLFSFLNEPARDFFNKKVASIEAKRLLDECDKGKDKEVCYAKELSVIASNKGEDYTFEVLESLQKIDVAAEGCHFLAHGIGTGLYKENPNEWQEIIRNISPACNYGAVHGVLEQHVATLPEGSLTEDLMKRVCGESPRADCNHIVGHLTLVETRGDIDKSLDMCFVFEDDLQRYFCLTGVFMEEITALNLIEHGYKDKSALDWSARVDELEALCRSYDGERNRACWKEIVHAALVKFNYEPIKTFEFCRSAENLSAQTACRDHSLGIIASHYNFNLNSIEEICSIKVEGEPDFEGICYEHLVGSMLATIPQEIDRATSFCSGLAEEYIDGCFAMIGSQLGQGACGEVPRNYQEACVSNPRQETYENLEVN